MAFALRSEAFADGEVIPRKYTCDGDEVLSPPLSVSGAPDGTKSFVLVMDDPDIPKAVKEVRRVDAFDHWVAYNISPDTREIPEGFAFEHEGLNTLKDLGYVGPCPPPQYEPKEHRYVFTLYALSDVLAFAEPPTKEEVLRALAPIEIGRAQLVGRYARG